MVTQHYRSAAAEAMVNMTGYQVVPIGWVESPLTERAQAPRQGDEGAPDAWLVFQPEVAEGIRDLTAGTEIIVLTSQDRGVPLQLPQAPGLGRGRELARVGGGQVAQPGADHVQRLTGICRGRRAHLVTSSPGRAAAAGVRCRPREGQASRI